MDRIFFIIIPNRRARVNNRNVPSRARKGEFAKGAYDPATVYKLFPLMPDA